MSEPTPDRGIEKRGLHVPGRSYNRVPFEAERDRPEYERENDSPLLLAESRGDKRYDAGGTTGEVTPPPCSIMVLLKALSLVRGSYVYCIGVESGGT